MTKQDNERLKQWLNEQVHFTHNTDYLEMKSYIQFRNWKIEPPSVGSLTRMIASAIDTYENNLYQITSQQLSPTRPSDRIAALVHSKTSIIRIISKNIIHSFILNRVSSYIKRI